jgi:transketolase
MNGMGVLVQQIGVAARIIRRDIIEMAHRSGGPHVGAALSCADILATLYHRVLRLDPWDERDIFILSKAHASMALYAALVSRGIMAPERLHRYCRSGGLPAHLDLQSGRGVECSGGSLGHGFNLGLGMAAGFKAKGSGRRVFALVGDGETQEGSIWEGALFAPRLGLDNVTVIVDYNNLQGYGRPREICSFEPLADKWASFGWEVATVDGHDHGALLSALLAEPAGRPRAVIARTVKGKGVSFMENQLIWHYYIVTDAIRHQALEELQ